MHTSGRRRQIAKDKKANNKNAKAKSQKPKPGYANGGRRQNAKKQKVKMAQGKKTLSAVVHAHAPPATFILTTPSNCSYWEKKVTSKTCCSIAWKPNEKIVD